MDGMKKISVVGAGAIGTMFGGLIKHRNPDVEVVLITRGEHLRQMRDCGHAELRGPWGRCEVPVTASSNPEDVIGSELVLFTVKTQDSEQTAKQFADLLGDAIFVSVQNGINQRILSKYIRSDRLLVGMTATNMAMIEPGVVSLQHSGVSVIGSPSPDVPTAIVERARQTLAASGLKIEATDHILGAQYNKLLFNIMGYASVLSASDFLREGVLDGPWRKNVAIPLLSEGLSVLKQANIPLGRTSGMSDIIRFGRLLRALNAPGVEALVRLIITKVLRPQRLVFSVYQDLLRHRPTEIDFVNGEIVRLAKECSMEAPYNAQVVEMVHNMEDSTEVEFLDREAVVSRFRDLRTD
jgi:2-dehydropantoate 2-reductase